jgi:L-fucose isomerase-like protein
MKKVGIIWLGHADYMNDNSSAINQAIKEMLDSLSGIQSCEPSVATNNIQAIAAARTILQTELCGAIIILSSWVECDIVMSAIKELRGLPFILWGFPLEEVNGQRESTGSYVSAAMIAGPVNRLGLHTDVLIGSWKDPDIQRQIQAFVRAAATADYLFYSRIGLFGYTSMSIYPGTFDHVLMRYLIGPEVEQLDSYSLITAAQNSSEAQIDDAIEKLRSLLPFQNDFKDSVLRNTMGIYVALRQFCAGHNWQAVNVKCQYEFSKEYRHVPCVALSLLADEGVVASCEGDIPNTVSMMLLHGLSSSSVTYGDALSHSGNTVTFSPCGFLPISMGQPGVRVQKFMEHPGFAGIQICGVLRPERVTYLRLVEDIGSYHIVYGTGAGKETSPRGGCMPALDVELDGDIKNFCNAYAGQHYAMAYGDLSDEIDAFAKIMGIKTTRIK